MNTKKDLITIFEIHDSGIFIYILIYFIIEIGNAEIWRANIIPYIMIDIFRKFFSFSKLRLSKEQLLIVYDKRKKGLTDDLNFVNSFVDYENIDENYMNNLESLESFEQFINVMHLN